MGAGYGAGVMAAARAAARAVAISVGEGGGEGGVQILRWLVRLPASAAFGLYGLWLRNVPCHDPCLAAVKPYAVYSSDAAGERIEGMCVCVA